MSIKSTIYDEGEYKSYMGMAEFDKAFASLLGIIQGISSDGIITEDEAIEIANWISLHSHLEKYQPFTDLIPLAHNALSDSVIDNEELQDIIWIIQQFNEGGLYYDINTLAIQALHGIFHGILSDNEINDQELNFLQAWVKDNRILKGTYPYDELESIVTNILSDGRITDEEISQLKVFMSDFIDCTKSFNISAPELDVLRKECQIEGLCSVDPVVIIENHSFCFTGASSRATRAEIEKVIVSKNGIFNDNVLKNTQYLIIGDEGNSCWSFSCYGRKVEKAMQMRKSGSTILIIHENDFWNVAL